MMRTICATRLVLRRSDRWQLVAAATFRLCNPLLYQTHYVARKLVVSINRRLWPMSATLATSLPAGLSSIAVRLCRTPTCTSEC